MDIRKSLFWLKVVTVGCLVVGAAHGDLFAGNIPKDTAIKVAQAYYGGTVESIYDATPNYYIFEMKEAGFVIVSATDSAEPILAVSRESYFKYANDIPLNDWLKNVNITLADIIKNHRAPSKEITGKWAALKHGQQLINNRGALAPLCKTIWNQSPYYNNYCPGGSVTGCVATCMGQIMKYYNYPPKGNGSSYYNATPYGQLSENYDSVINWQKMSNNLTGFTLADSVSDVALFLFKCGVSVDMQYSPSESGAYVTYLDGDSAPCAQYAFVHYWNYNAKTLKNLSFSNFTTSKWDSIIYAENNAGRVVEYVGFGSDGGHTWVEDGYNSDGLMHMNWGWGGLDNGYYSEAALNPSGIPLSNDNEILIGIQPGTTHNCGTPTQPVVSAIEDTQALYSFFAADSANSFNIAYQQAGASSWLETISFNTSALIHPLYTGTTYMCEVQQNCLNGGSSGYATIDTFKTLGATECVTPANVSAFTQSYSCDIKWDVVPNAKGYIVKYSPQGAINWLYDTTDDNGITIATEPSTAYFYGVQTLCPQDTSLSTLYSGDSYQFFTYAGCDSVTGLSSDSIGVGSAKLIWADSGGIYNLTDTCLNPSGNGNVTGSYNDVSSPFYLSGIPTGTIEWTVTRSCDDGGSIDSRAYFTTTGIYYQQPPINARVIDITPASATLVWDSIPYLWDYNLQFRNSDITCYTNSYAATGLMPGTNYQFVVQALSLRYGLSLYCAPVYFTTPDSITYCNVRGSTTVEYIKSFTFGNTTNLLRDTKGYGDFVKDTIAVQSGISYTVSVTPGFTRNNIPQDEYWTVFADYNHSGNLKLIAAKHGDGTLTGTITIPDTALSGAARLRIIMHRGSYIANPCKVFSNGDVADYTLGIETEPVSLQVNAEPMVSVIRYYPDPTTGTVNFNQPVSIQVYNILGEILFTATNVNTIDLSGYAKGIYILRFAGGQVNKIVKI